MFQKVKLPSNWELISLKDIIKLSSGKTRPKNLKNYPKDEFLYPVYGGNGIIGYSKEYLIDSKTIAIGRVGAYCGSIHGTENKIWITDNALYVKEFINEQNVDFNYLMRVLSILNLNKLKKTGGQPLISQSTVYSQSIPLPPLETQKRIVQILERAGKMKKWRVESDALADEYLKSIFLELFGDHRKNDKNFEIKSFLDIFNLTTGKLNSNASVENGKYPFFTCSKETFKIDNYSFDCEALLLSGNNAAGEYSIKYYNGKFDAYQRTYILSLRDKNNSYEFYRMLLEEKLKELKDKSIGTNTKYLTLNILKRINLIEPNYELQNQFEKIVKLAEILKTHQLYSKQEIDNLFNTLTQKAFKGELIC